MLYGVFCGTKWGMTRNRRLAIAKAKEIQKESQLPAQVRAMNEPESTYWDMPTFIACSLKIWPEHGPAILPKAIC